MRNIQTGYVPPQYHCVFGNFFETVFSSKSGTHTIDKICDEIFQDIQNFYSEEEYEDGNLVFHPPLLHEVWLTEPDNYDWIQKLRQQSQCA